MRSPPLNISTRRIALVLLAATLLGGCLRTEVTQVTEEHVEGIPYQKILVCSMSTEVSAQDMESIMAELLRKHRVTAEICSALTGEMADYIQNQHFDGVLITQRVVTPKPDQSPRAANVLGGPNVMHPPAEKQILVDAFPNLQSFITAYHEKHAAVNPAAIERERKESRETLETPLGKEVSVHARADLIAVRENRPVWSLGGMVVDGSDHRPQELMRSFAKVIESGLVKTKIISR